MNSSQSRAVVVGVDESDSARDAAEWAADIAALWGAPLHLVHVVPGAPDDSPPGLRPPWLAELCASAVRAGADPAGTEVIPGNTVDMLADRAAEARLLVLGSYGTGAWSGMLAGSVALALMQRVSCPVVVVRGSAPQVPPPRGGPIVVGVDGAAAGQAALEFAANLADALGARLVAVHTWTDVTVDRDGALHRLDEDEAVLARRAAARLDAALAPIAAAHPRLAVQRETVGDTPLRALMSRTGGARLLVVGHRTVRPEVGMALGSTSQALIEFGPCPIAVVKPISQAQPASAPPPPQPGTELMTRKSDSAAGIALGPRYGRASVVDPAGVGLTTAQPAHPTAWQLPAYAERAGRYDRDTAVHQQWRRQLVAALRLRSGATVLDVGCGTGLCFPLLLDRIGPSGMIIGIDSAPEMLAQARRKVETRGWTGVHLIGASAEHADIPGLADAAIFSAVHDVLQSAAALDNVFNHLRPRAPVAAAGGKWPAPWQLPLWLYVRSVHADYIHDFAGFDRPWRPLEPRLDGFRVTEVAFGSGFIATGRVPANDKRRVG